MRGCYLRLLALPGLIALASACHPDPDLTATPTPPPWRVPVPAGLGVPAVPTPTRNPLTRAGVALGRMLFYDPRLSGTNTVSCATCHQPERAFSDGRALSAAGVSGRPLLRHAPALQNLAWARGLFWDGGATDLESQVFGPLTSPDEMNQPLAALEAELLAVPAYQPLFAAAFPEQVPALTSVTVARALAQFQRTLLTGDSPYDRWRRHEPGAAPLAPAAQAGMLVVDARCGTCHPSPFFTDETYRNNGLDSTFSADNERLAWGRGRITNQPADRGRYRTPTLRNVALTAPYMHDGRFATLDDVLDHYDHGLRPSPTLDPALPATGLRLTPLERQQIQAFLQTLTDTSFVQRPALRP